jgi:methyltransferase
MWTNIVILSLITLQRIAEFHIARRNTARLLGRGGFEMGTGHFPFIVMLQIVWLAGLWYFAFRAEIQWPWIYGYAVLEAARGWIIAALGDRWTTKIIVMPEDDGAAGGMSSYFRHPNYFIVTAECFILPMAFGLWWYAGIFAVSAAGLYYLRIRAENEALKPLRDIDRLPDEADSAAT